MKYIRLWEGWGDSIYQRPVIAALCSLHKDIILETPLPQLFHDLPLTFTPHNTTLRTQSQNVRELNELDFPWVSAPKRLPVQLGYTKVDFWDGLNVFEAIERRAKVKGEVGKLRVPLKDAWVGRAQELSEPWGKFALVKGNTVRDEWYNPARNCHGISIDVCLDVLERHNITSVLVGCVGRGEHFHGAKPTCDFDFSEGQIDMFTLMALGQIAEVTVGPVGNIIPIGLSLQNKTFVIAGGYQDTASLFDERYLDDMVEVVSPDNPCNCFNHNHECSKDIEEGKVEEAFRAFLNVG